MRNWVVFVSLHHTVQMTADEIAHHGPVLEFRRDGNVIGQYTGHLGWCEIFGEQPKSATVLSLVPTPPPA